MPALFHRPAAGCLRCFGGDVLLKAMNVKTEMQAAGRTACCRPPALLFRPCRTLQEGHQHTDGKLQKAHPDMVLNTAQLTSLMTVNDFNGKCDADDEKPADSC